MLVIVVPWISHAVLCIPSGCAHGGIHRTALGQDIHATGGYKPHLLSGGLHSLITAGTYLPTKCVAIVTCIHCSAVQRR